MNEAESIGDIVKRVVSKSAAKWQGKNSSEQTIQRIDDITALVLPDFVCRMNVGKEHYPAGAPPMPDVAALSAMRDAYNAGLAADLSDAAIRSRVASKLVEHWKGMIAQEDAAKKKPRAKLKDAWPT